MSFEVLIWKSQLGTLPVSCEISKQNNYNATSHNERVGWLWSNIDKSNTFSPRIWVVVNMYLLICIPFRIIDFSSFNSISNCAIKIKGLKANPITVKVRVFEMQKKYVGFFQISLKLVWHNYVWIDISFTMFICDFFLYVFIWVLTLMWFVKNMFGRKFLFLIFIFCFVMETNFNDWIKKIFWNF